MAGISTTIAGSLSRTTFCLSLTAQCRNFQYTNTTGPIDACQFLCLLLSKGEVVSVRSGMKGGQRYIYQRYSDPLLLQQVPSLPLHRVGFGYSYMYTITPHSIEVYHKYKHVLVSYSKYYPSDMCGERCITACTGQTEDAESGKS